MRQSTIAMATVLATTSISIGAELVEPLEPLEPLLGTWEATGQWEWGSSLWARTTYEPILGGAFIEATTYTSEDDGPVYLRYHVILAPSDDPDAFDAHSFDVSGAYTVTRLALDEADGHTRFVSEWAMGETTVRDTLTLTEPGQSRWVVQMSPAGSDQWAIKLDTNWRRVESGPAPKIDARPAAEALLPLAPFLGVWEVTTDWFNGGVLWAQTRSGLGAGGKILRAQVIATENAEPVYDRYRTFYYARPGGQLREVGFTYRGEILENDAVIEHSGDGPTLVVSMPPTDTRAIAVRKSLNLGDTTRMHWISEFKAPDAQQWTVGVDADWRRVGDAVGPHTDKEHAMARPIDHEMFVSSGAAPGMFERTREIKAPVEEVYKAWTTNEGWRAVYSDGRPEIGANIELAIGGAYEWLFDGAIGSNGCQILSYIPNRMLSFSWNAPPTQPLSRAKHTWVVVEFEPIGAGEGGGTLVRLTHLGFGAEAHWDETYEYFSKAWEFVLNRMAEVLEARG